MWQLRNNYNDDSWSGWSISTRQSLSCNFVIERQAAWLVQPFGTMAMMARTDGYAIWGQSSNTYNIKISKECLSIHHAKLTYAMSSSWFSWFWGDLSGFAYCVFLWIDLGSFALHVIIGALNVRVPLITLFIPQAISSNTSESSELARVCST